MECYPALKRKGILSYALIRVKLESIILSEITQTKTNTAWCYLYVESEGEKKDQTHKNTEWKSSWLWQGWGAGSSEGSRRGW